MPNQKPPFYRLKIISCGDVRVGKSTLIKRYCEKRFVSEYHGTIGVDFGVKKVILNDLELRINFWDLSGDPAYFEVRNEFYSGAQGMLLCFDVSVRESFDHLSKWMQEAKKNDANLKQMAIVVCGNKTDTKKRKVKGSEGVAFAKSIGGKYFETSAALGDGVNEMFESLFQKVMKKFKIV